jgi:glutathione synthase/RimK-type ligase-like ATP-grasp enzyme
MLRNSRKLIEWNVHKSYIHKLAFLGLPVVPTKLVFRGESHDIQSLAEEQRWVDIVIKPALGAASHAVKRVRNDRGSLADGQAHFEALISLQDVLVQPYFSSVDAYGERSLVFFNGRFSHAVVKKPFDTVLVVSSERSARVMATDQEISTAHRAIESLPDLPLYARVDLLRDADNGICISEVELIEPGLYLAVHDDALVKFADAIEPAILSVAPFAREGVQGYV